MEHKGFLEQLIVLDDTIPVNTCHLAKPMKCTTPRINPSINSELWAIICQCRFIDCNNYTITLMDFDIKGGYTYVGGRVCMGNVYIPLNFPVSPKLFLRKSV